MPVSKQTYVAQLTTTPCLANLGGKGKSLASLISAGFPVPDGFHITTGAYRRFIEQNGLNDSLVSMASPVVLHGSLLFDSAAANIQALIVNGVFPEDIKREITDAYEACNGAAVAVRSSATAEDLPDPLFCRSAGYVPGHHGHRSTAGLGPKMLGFPLDRTRHQLPAPDGSSTS